MTLEEMQELSNEDKKSLVDFIEGLPNNLNLLIKLHINDNFMDPALYKGRTRFINEYATIKKYISKNMDVKDVDYSASQYQSDYCELIESISNNSDIPVFIKGSLCNLASANSYDIKSMIDIETGISSIFDRCMEKPDINSNPSIITSLANFINTTFMFYKFDTYDFYTYISLKDEFHLDRHDSYYFRRLHSAIMKNIVDDSDSYSYQKNAAILIYIYFKELGVENVIDKYHLFNRFKYWMLHHYKNDEYISSVKSTVDELILERCPVSEALNRLVYTSYYDDLIYSNKKLNLNAIDSGKNVAVSNGTAFLFKDTFILGNKLEDLTTKIDKINSDTISAYMSDSDITDGVSFLLTDNDYGHLKHLDDLVIGTAYSNSTNELKYVGCYKGEFYVFFKCRMHPRIIYGVSLDSIGTDKKILEIKESKAFYYKYKSEL